MARFYAPPTTGPPLISSVSVNRSAFIETSQSNQNKRYRSRIERESHSAFSHSKRNKQKRKSLMNLLDYEEEQELRETKWLLKKTAMLLATGDNAHFILDKRVEVTSQSPLGQLTYKDIQTSHVVMRGWARRSSMQGSHAPHVIEKIIERLIQEREAGNKNAVVGTNIYNILLDAWAQSKISGAAYQAQAVLDQMEDLSHRFAQSEMKPNAMSYTRVIRAWENSEDPNAEKNIESILTRMEERSLKPTIYLYNQLISLYAKKDRRDKATAPIKVQEILDKLIESLFRNTTDSTQYTTSTIHPSRSDYNRSLSLARPNTDIFNAVMGAWLRSGSSNSTDSIEKLLDQMHQLYTCGICPEAKPDQYSVNIAITAFSKSRTIQGIQRAHALLRKMKEKYQVLPDRVSYNILIDAYSKSTMNNKGHIAEELLDEMEEKFVTDKNNQIMPDEASYTSVITAYYHDRKYGAHRAERVLQKMERFHKFHGGKKPSTAVYNALMNIYAGQSHRASIKRAQEIFELMEEQCQSQNNSEAKPNIRSYNTLLKAFSQGKQNYDHQAETILNHMEDMYASNPQSAVRPDVFTYTTVISTIAKSDAIGKARKAEKILNRMMKVYEAGNLSAQPSIFAFNAVASACAYTVNEKDKVDALIILATTWNALNQFSQPDMITYGLTLQGCCSLIPEDNSRRNIIATRIFQKCLHDGKCGDYVMQQLRLVLPPDLFLSATGTSKVT